MGKVGCDIWEKWVKTNTSLHARIKVRRLRVHFGLDMLRKGPSCDALASISEKKIQGEIWEEWALTYGRNGSSEKKKQKNRIQR